MSRDISSAMSLSMANVEKVIVHKSINFPHLFPFSAAGTRSIGTRQIEFVTLELHGIKTHTARPDGKRDGTEMRH